MKGQKRGQKSADESASGTGRPPPENENASQSPAEGHFSVAGADRFRTFIEQSSDGIWLFELDEPIPTHLPVEEQTDLIFERGYLAECNKVFAEQYGYDSPEQVLGARLPDMLLPDDPKNRDFIKAFIESGYRLSNAESHERDVDGHDRYFLNNFIGSVTDGALERAWGMQRDITDSKSFDAARAHLAAIVESSDDAIISKDLDGTIRSWNAGAARIFGYSAEEAIGKHITFIIPEGREKEEAEILERVRRGQSIEHFETVRLRKDGAVIHVSVSVSPIRDVNGNIIGASKIARDITERNEAEERFNQNRMILTLAMESSRMGAWQQDIATGVVWWSEELEHIFGLATGAFSQTENAYYDLMHEDDRESVWAEVASAIAEHRSYSVEFRFRHADGSVRWMEGRGEAVYSQTGEPVRLYGVGIDITERKRTEEALRESEERFRLALSSGAVTVYEQDANLRYEWVYPRDPYREDVLGKTDLDLVSGEFGQRLSELKLKVLATGSSIREEIGAVLNGEERWFDLLIDPRRNREGQTIGVGGTALDITQRKRAEIERSHAQEKLRESEERLRAIFDSTAVGVAMLDTNAKFLQVNDAFCRLTGYDRNALLGTDCGVLTHPDDRAEMSELITELLSGKRNTFDLEKRYIRPDGRLIWVHNSVSVTHDAGGRPVHLIAISQDITDRKAAENLTQRYQLLSEQSRDVIWLLRPNGDIVEANKAAIAAYGYSRSELVGMNIRQLRHPSTLNKLSDELSGASAGSIHFETVHLRKDGTSFPVEVTANGAEIGGEQYLMSIVRDISERKQAEKVLRESEERFAKAFNSSPLVVTLTSLRTGRLTEVNETFVRVTGYSREEAIGKTTEELGLWSGDDRASELSILQHDGAIRNREYEFRMKDGSVIVGLLSAEILEIGGEPSALTVIQDVTERKRSEESLRQSEQRLQQMADAMPQVVWVANSDGVVTYYNHRVSQFDGVGPDSNGNWDWSPAVHPDDLERTADAWQRAAALKSNYSIEHRLRMADGAYRWHLSRAIPILDERGEVTRWYGTATDIHDLKIAEEKMVAAERRAAEEYYAMLSRIVPLAQILGTARELNAIYRGVLDFIRSSMPCSAFFVSFYEGITNLRTAAFAWGIDAGEVDISSLPPVQLTAGGGPNSQAVFERKPAVVNRYMDHMRDRTHVVVEEDGINPNSSMALPMIVMDRVIGTIEVQAYENEAFTKEHVIAVEMVANLAAVAIENVRLIETEARARKEAEAANRMKDEFLSVLSHELRTPLNAMLGWVRMLRTGVLDPERTAKALEVIERNTRQQGSLIEDLLDVSRIISGRMRVETDLIDLVPVVNMAAESIRPLALNKGIKLEVFADLEPLYIDGDPVRLQQMVTNLLQNALKFTAAGGALSLKLEKADDKAVITVRDTGVGIEKDFLPHIFDRFSQADASTRRNYTGLGLGLTIVKTIVELHNGDIKASSDGKDKGAAFTIWLPLQKEFYSSGNSISAESNGSSTRLAGTSILLVDDDAESLVPIQMFLERHQANVECANSADEALAKLASRDFHVLISDIAMPAVDGYQFLELIRSVNNGRNSRTPAIAVTSYASADDRQRVLAAGFQDHIAKPVDFDLLLAAIDSVRRNAR